MRLVLADPHPIFLNGLEDLLRREDGVQVVARCSSAAEALRAVRELAPDILLFDPQLPGTADSELLRTIQREQLPTRVVVLTAALDEEQMMASLRLGVRGVVLKEMAPRLLVECLRKVQAGEQWLEKRSVSRALEKLLRSEDGERELSGALTQREAEIVRMIARGLTNKEVARHLAIREGTVKVHLHSIYVKLKLADRRALARWAEEKGVA